jgi:hypothetical protein
MSQIKVNAVTDGSGGNTATINSMTPTADSLQGFRNRIINGDMRIDQRNAGAAVTGLTGGQYVVDRWTAFQNYGTVTTQQSTTAPTGFVNSLYTTVTSTASVSTNSIYSLVQNIEGTNVSDLGFGTASAKTITISFQVRSSVTGTYGVFIRNSAANRYYTSTFSISVANTWETKSITLTGDTGGTWLTSTGIGLTFGVVLGAGATRQGTANTWTASSNGPYTTSSQVDWMSNAGATFFISGVQLEVGSVATPFERRDYGRELAMCERYYQVINSSMSISTGTTAVRCSFNLRTYMRSQPTVSQTGVYNANYPGVGTFTQSSVNVAVETGDDSAYGLLADFGNFTGLTAQRVYMFRPSVDGQRITFESEL